MLVIYHQPFQPHPVERTVLASIDSSLYHLQCHHCALNATILALVPRLGLDCPSTSTGSSIALVPRLGLYLAVSTSIGQTH
jgi:hypothetical protein